MHKNSHCLNCYLRFTFLNSTSKRSNHQLFFILAWKFIDKVRYWNIFILSKFWFFWWTIFFNFIMNQFFFFKLLLGFRINFFLKSETYSFCIKYKTTLSDYPSILRHKISFCWFKNRCWKFVYKTLLYSKLYKRWSVRDKSA